MPSLSDRIRDMDACREAQTWVDSLPPETTPEAAWVACARGDWLLWVAARIGVAKKEFLPGFAGEASMRVMRELRRALDPRGILNPGKMFDVAPVTTA